MNKEEQIKKLAQNLFNKGFTNSMDFAVSTAAKMLGFPDTMLNNSLMRNEEAKFGGESVLNGGQFMGENRLQSQSNPIQSKPQESKPLHEECGMSQNLKKKISQSIAEERVYSMIPGAVRDAVANTDFNQSQNTNPQSYENVQLQNNDNQQINIQSNEQVEISTNNEVNEVEKPKLVIDYSPEEKKVTSFNEQNMFSEPKLNSFNGFENNSSLNANNNMIQNNGMETKNEIHAEQEVSSAQNLFESQNPIQNNAEHAKVENNISEDIFIQSKEEEPQIENNMNNSFDSLEKFEQKSLNNEFIGMQETQIPKEDIQNEIPAMEMESSEDFFTTALNNNENLSNNNVNNDVLEQNAVAQNNMITAVSPQINSSPQPRPVVQECSNNNTNNCEEANIDLTQMFDFKNLKN